MTNTRMRSVAGLPVSMPVGHRESTARAAGARLDEQSENNGLRPFFLSMRFLSYSYQTIYPRFFFRFIL